MHIRALVGALATAFSGAVAADSIDVNLNHDSIQAIYATRVSTAEVNFGFLNNSDRNDWVASAGLLVLGDNRGAQTRTEIGVGGKAYFASVGNQNIYALGLGGQGRVFPNNGPIGIGGYAFYAPDVVTGGHGKQFWEAGARVEFEMIKNTASVYLGYRKVRAELDVGGKVTVDSGGNVGLQINF
jgi:hypothetical protein